MVIPFSSYGMTNNQITNAIQEYLTKNNINKGFSINKKIKLPDCKKDIEIKKKYNSFKTLEIICNEDNPWTYNIRTKIIDNKNNLKKVKKSNKTGVRLIKLNKSLKKGQKVSADDIYFVNTNKKGAYTFFIDEKQVLGRKAKISLRKGQILRERHIEKNWTIKEGQKIIIENNKSNIQILIDGIALNSAMQDEYVEVLNKSTGKKIKAWVKNNKKVSIFR